MRFVVLSALLVMANVFGAGMIVPQVVKLYRTRLVEGISGTWVGVGVAMNMWWLAYAIAVGASGLVPVSIAGVVLYSAIAWLYIGAAHRAKFGSLAVGYFLLGSLPIPFLVVGGWRAAGLAIGFSYGFQFAPAAISALRSEGIEGIASATWIMAWIEAAIWLVYGLAIDDRALVIGGAGGAIMATIVLIRLASAPEQRFGARRNVVTLRSSHERQLIGEVRSAAVRSDTG